MPGSKLASKSPWNRCFKKLMPKSCPNLKTTWNRVCIRRMFPHLGKSNVRKNPPAVAFYRSCFWGWEILAASVRWLFSFCWLFSLCHPWFTTTNLSYRFPIFETKTCRTTSERRSKRRQKTIPKTKSNKTLQFLCVLLKRHDFSNQVLTSYLRWFPNFRHDFSIPLYLDLTY